MFSSLDCQELGKEVNSVNLIGARDTALCAAEAGIWPFTIY
jgi:hypothetical protein